MGAQAHKPQVLGKLLDATAFFLSEGWHNWLLENLEAIDSALKDTRVLGQITANPYKDTGVWGQKPGLGGTDDLLSVSRAQFERPTKRIRIAQQARSGGLLGTGSTSAST